MATCNEIIRCFWPFPCNYGQAQKWINMAIKYCWFFSDGTKLDAWYSVAHMPVDEFILRAAVERAVIKRAHMSWSRWDQHTYKAFQDEIRDHATKRRKTPLALEHDWWMEEAAKPRLVKSVARIAEALSGRHGV